MALSGEERSKAQIAVNQLKATNNYHMATLAYRATAESDRARTQTEKDLIMGLANNAYNDGGSDFDKAITSANASTDPVMAKYRVQVIGQLNAAKAAGLKPAEVAAQTTNADARTASIQRKDAAPLATGRQHFADMQAYAKDPANSGKPAPDGPTLQAWKAAQKPPAPAPATPQNTAGAGAGNTNMPKTWNVGGRTYKVGDPISIQGKTYSFQGLDANGRIQVNQ